MASPTSEPTASFAELRSRLQQAEASAREALANSEESSPLARATEELLAVHREVRRRLGDTFEAEAGTQHDDPEVHSAEIEIEREQHTIKTSPKDVLKALFMWRDDPVERAKGGGTRL